LAESDIQAAIVAFLRMIGYNVRQTTIRGWRRDDKGYGADRGVADLLISYPGWGVSIELEVKGPRTLLSKAQSDLRNSGIIHIVRGVDDAAAAILDVQTRYSLGGPLVERVTDGYILQGGRTVTLTR
jgi:hypothetical protein